MKGIRTAVAVGALLLVVSCGGDDGDAEAEGEAGTTAASASAATSAGATTPTGSATSVAAASTGAPGTTVAPTIGVADFTFKPATVPRGSTVRLANGDSVEHTVESRDGAWTFDAATQTFPAPSAPGAYAIFCGIHESMTGTLTVA